MKKVKIVKGTLELEEYINLEDVDRLITVAFENDIEVLCIEGTLLDSYLIYNDNKIAFNRKTSRYIIIGTKYLNSNSSANTLTFTDDDNLALQFEDEFNRFYDDYDDED